MHLKQNKSTLKIFLPSRLLLSKPSPRPHHHATPVKIVPLSPSIGAIASGVATWLLAIGFSTIGGGLAEGFGGGVKAGCSSMFEISMILLTR